MVGACCLYRDWVPALREYVWQTSVCLFIRKIHLYFLSHSLPHYIKAFVGIPSWVSITLRLISTQVVIEGMIGKGSSGGIAVDDIIIANHILPEQCKGRLLNIG